MASKYDDSSPPRSDMVSRTRRQSIVPDSPSRVTRSQLRRQSSNSSLPSPPKPTTSRKRPLRGGGIGNDVLSQDIPPLEKGVLKPPQRSTRRSTRISVTDSVEDGSELKQEGKLESIVEVVKASPRRTRASARVSVKASYDSDTENRLPTTRRTRQNSGSSIASASSCTASVTSPQRRTRSRKNLSPVQSSFSDTYSLLEIPEASPQTKKTPSPEKGRDSNASSKSATPITTPQSLKESPASLKSSGKKLALRLSSSEQSSPSLKRHDASFTRSKKGSPNNQEQEVSNTSLSTDERRRRSKGRLSLSSRRSSLKQPQFVETPFEDSKKKQQNEEPVITVTSTTSFDEPAEKIDTASEWNCRKSDGRSSLSSNKSSAPSSPSCISKSSDALKSRYSTRSSKSPVPLQQEASPEEESVLSRRASTEISMSPGTPSVRSSVSPWKSSSGLVPRIVLSSINKSPEQKEEVSDSDEGEASPNGRRNSENPVNDEVMECESSAEISDEEIAASEKKGMRSIPSFLSTSAELKEKDSDKDEEEASLPKKGRNSEVSSDEEVVECESTSADSDCVEIVASPVKQGKISDGSKGGEVAFMSSSEREGKDEDSDEVMKCQTSPKSSPEQERKDSKNSDSNEFTMTQASHALSASHRFSLGNVLSSIPCDSVTSSTRASTGSTSSRIHMQTDDLLPSTSPNDSYCEHIQFPSNVLEKLSMLNKSEVSLGEEISLSVKKSLSPKEVISPGFDMTLHEAEKSVSSKRNSSEGVCKNLFDQDKDVDSKIPPSPDRMASKAYKDAAFLLSGGTVSDFEEPDSDDNKWQLVFSPSTKSRKEQRMEKKAKKKEEKELRKKAKLERAEKFAHTLVKKNESDSSNRSQFVRNELDHLSPQKSVDKENKKRLVSEEDDKLDDSSDSLPAGADYCSQILKHFNIDVSGIGSTEKERKGRVSKRKGVGEELASSEQQITKSQSEAGNKKKEKKLKKALDGGIDFTCETHDNPPTKIKKKKKLVDGEVLMKETCKELTGENGLNEGSGAHIDQTVRNKKKKHSKVQNLIAEDTAASKKTGKKSKKRKCESSLHDAVNTDDAPKKKKLKREKELALSSDSVLGAYESSENTNSNVSKEKKLKKKKILSELSHAGDQSTEVLKKKKKKKVKEEETISESSFPERKRKIENASDSDEAPVAVSFAEGKQEALAELQAAAENIKRQKELKQQKLRRKLDKIKEQKLAKSERIKEKRKHLRDAFGQETESGAGSSLRMHSQEDYVLQKSNMKPPKRLPIEVVESLSEQPPTSLLERPGGSKERENVSTLSKEEQDRLERKQARKLAKKLKKRKLQESEYIPLEGVLGPTRFGLVPLRNIMIAKKLEQNKLAEEAANFRHQSLFGNRIRRTPRDKILAHQEKLKASGKDLLVTYKKN